VLIKFGLEDIPPLPFAGLRYTLAFACLLPVAAARGHLSTLRTLDARTWTRLAALGLLLYAATQGAQFVALDRLPAVTTSLLLSFTAILVALMGVVLLREHPDRLQWIGLAAYLAGVVWYFYPPQIATGEAIGLAAALVGVLANALSSVLGRAVNRDQRLDPLAITVASMGIGAVVLLAGGIAVEGLPRLSVTNWLVIGWLAAVNSAFAFTLWNRTLRVLSAMESSIINNTMLFQIALLAWIFLGEGLSAQQVVGTLLAGLGTLLVQLRRE
jgi:drug/metabolite transporter (DMT)-like permease